MISLQGWSLEAHLEAHLIDPAGYLCSNSTVEIPEQGVKSVKN